MPPKSRPLLQRWLEKVLFDDGCWLWTGALKANGYGVVGRGGREGGSDYAHRVAYELFVGPIPEGMFVCHKCDTPACVNPSHLFLGTPRDNSQDASRKGRMEHGEDRHCAVLTEPKVIEARALLAMGDTTRAVAEHFGVSCCAIQKIREGKTWRHL